MIKDSGQRTNFETGAVRDIQEGKGRCDLMPLDVVGELIGSPELTSIAMFKTTGDTKYLYNSVKDFITNRLSISQESMMLEVAKHFEDGAKKYGENNWQKGIPVSRYIDSAVRHFLKYCAGWEDEPHDRAFCWNVLCCIWTKEHKVDLDDFSLASIE